MAIYAIPPFLTSLLLFILGLFILLKNTKSSVNLSFFLLCVTSALWEFSYSQAYNTLDQETALHWFKIGYPAVTFIAITYFHFSSSFFNLKTLKIPILCAYMVGGILIYLFRTTNLIMDGTYHYFWGYYPKAGAYHPLFLVFFMGLLNIAIGQFAYFYFFQRKRLSLLKIQQIKYVLLALSIYTIACVDFIANYGIAFYPFGFIPATIFILLIGYGVFRYRLMNISIALTRTSIFVLIYSLVLGIPFAMAFGWREKLYTLFGESWWVAPLLTSTVLATAGPFAYVYIQRRAEDRLLQNQRRYQMTLRNASAGMGRIKNLRKLLALMVHIVTRTVRIEHGAIYLYDKQKKEYLLMSARKSLILKKCYSFRPDAAFIQYMQKTGDAILYDEVEQRAKDYNDSFLIQVCEQMKILNAAIIIPSFIEEEKLVAFLVLGKKKSGEPYTGDDIAVFSILSNQSALAIENAQFYEEAKRTQEQLFQAEKMATIGTMADGLSHQINNRLHALGFIAGDALDTIQLKAKNGNPKELRAVMEELRHSLTRILENVKQGGEIVEGLLKYTRKGEAGFQPVDFQQLLKASLEMASYKVKLGNITIQQEIPNGLMPIKGNFTQLQEVFFNIIDNAYDAMMQRKEEFKEEGYKPTLRIVAECVDHQAVITVTDNGIGVKDEDKDKLFTPFFTTKLSSKKGTGLGLYVIRRIIEENHRGKVDISSNYGEGTSFTICLQLWQEVTRMGSS